MFWNYWKSKQKKKLNLDLLFRSMRNRLIVIYTLFISAIGLIFLAVGIIAYQKTYYERATEFISEITNQTTYNLQQNISQADFLSYSILTNSTIQEQLKAANVEYISASKLTQIKQQIWSELVSLSYSGNGLESLSVLSDTGYEYTFQKSYGRDIEVEIDKEEIYEANGTLIWKLKNNGNQISAARAILNLDTMKPLGYIYMVFDDSSFADIVRDISDTCTASAFIADEEGTILLYNLTEKEQILEEELAQKRTDASRIREISEKSRKATFFYGDRLSNGWQLILAVPESTFWNEMADFLYVILVAIILGILLAIVINAFVSKKIAEPTRIVMNTMDQFGKGNLSVRCNISNDDEVGQIGRQFNQLADDIEKLINKVYALELVNRQTEIEALKMQINPHFLYNTLDTISWLGIMRGNEDVSDIAVTLADFLRSIINRSDFASIEEELNGIYHYLHIQSYRFGDKIETVCEVDETVKSCKIPSFILQPLIENSIIHGIEPRSQKGILCIRIQMCEGAIHICVEDNGKGMTREQLSQLWKQMTDGDNVSSVGISNVYKRLHLYYGESCRFTITSMENEGTKVSFYIPLNEKEEKNER